MGGPAVLIVPLLPLDLAELHYHRLRLIAVIAPIVV